MKNLVALLLTLTASLSFGYSSGEVILTGKVRSFDSNSIILQSNSVRYKIPRNLVLVLELKTNQILEVELTDAEFKSLETTQVK